MYCRQCGNLLNSNTAEFCPACGFRPLNSNLYCQHCGAATSSKQELCINCKKLLLHEKNLSYAGFWRRFIAALIDGLILALPMTLFWAIFTVVIYAVSESPYFTEQWLIIVEILAYIVSIIVGILYFGGMHSSKWQATFGKRLVGIKVIGYNGERISFIKGAARYLATFLSGLILYIGYIMAGITTKKQALHDLIAKTIVVKS